MAGPTLPELKAKVDELQATVDTEQQQIADLLAANQATVVSLNETIAAQQVLIAEGGTPEERQAILDQLLAIKADVATTVPPAE